MKKSAKWIAVFLSSLLVAASSAAASAAGVSPIDDQDGTQISQVTRIAPPNARTEGGGTNENTDQPDTSSSDTPPPDTSSSETPPPDTSSSEVPPPDNSSSEPAPPDNSSTPSDEPSSSSQGGSASSSKPSSSSKASAPDPGNNSRASSSENIDVGGNTLLPGGTSRHEEVSSQDWDRLLSAIPSDGSSLPPIEEVFGSSSAALSSAAKSNGNGSMMTWLGIALIVLAVGGIGFVVYTIFFAKGGHPPVDTPPTDPGMQEDGEEISSADPTSADYGDDYHYYDDDAEPAAEPEGPTSTPQDFTQEFTSQPEKKEASYPDPELEAPVPPKEESAAPGEDGGEDPFWDQFFR